MAATRAYHHGDLRRSILSAALEVIRSDGVAAISLRDLARRAEVSHAAPAHHFKDKAGLLTAIATEGFELLAAALTAVPAGTTHRLREMGVRYVEFALDHPAHFDVMFRPQLLHVGDPELTAARERASRALASGVEDLPDMRAGLDARRAGLTAWSLAHGFATLQLGGSLPPLDDDPAEAFRALVADRLVVRLP
ncbi:MULTISPECIES: TetR/AcrR family transcriptional regulator [Streptomyces]|uniref:TetR/AcrR family transcriptional regulator n=1 Tax=Streptomyces TaxID=1883 RepID=UPI000D0C833B|nr:MULTISPECIES: TetR/AcrR family transcriptional regulator [Streptomyces]MDX3349730.1 TetR/AcrR family transcriptional regulator [Streptomyces sp. ME02-6979A]PSK50652.1 HTH-type transcriptional regulator BetI [Streptomyces sp. 111WW2]WTC10847.1 TetR/AcrR family transcriptional regulator [Streptomyces anthocyanicus]